MSLSFDEQVFLTLLAADAADDSVPTSLYQQVMGCKPPVYEADPLAWRVWVEEARGRVVAAQADAVVAGYEAHQAAIWRAARG